MKIIKALVCVVFIFVCHFGTGQSLRFAFISDTHVGGTTGAEDLERSVQDINENHDLKFVILTGDVTEFGSDKELRLAKSILGKLNKPLYVIPGNHESTWSESGTNTFRQVFGDEKVCFTCNGYLFVGTSCGPSMKMSPGQVPREEIVWLDSVLSVKANRHKPVIFLNHYPLDSSLNNWYEIIRILRKVDVRIVLNGHGHVDRVFDYEGIPGVMGRSNLRANRDTGAYNIVTVTGDSMYFQNKQPFGILDPTWTVQYVGQHNFDMMSPPVRPSYAINLKYRNVREDWRYNNSSDIGSGLSQNFTKNIFTTDTHGDLFALDIKKGNRKWTFHSEGKIYSVPFFKDGIVVFSSSNGDIYGVDAEKGQQRWVYHGTGPSVGSPLIVGDSIYIGSSDGHFRSLDLRTGRLFWDYANVEGFVIDRPVYNNGIVYFGSWGCKFYALNSSNGRLVWLWENGSPNRMFSPAGCWPVCSNGKIFIVAPDNYMTSFNALNGKVINRRKWANEKVRESMGISTDGSIVYVKTMSGHIWGIGAKQDSLITVWNPEVNLGYEICPTHLVNTEDLLFVPTQSGTVVAIYKRLGQVAWIHKISNCMVTGIQPVASHKILVSTADGIVVKLTY